MRALIAAALLAGCGIAAPDCPAPIPAIRAPPVAKPPLIPPPPPTVVTTVIENYKAVARKEPAAVTASDVTPEQVQAVHAADRRAQRAMLALERQGRHPQPSLIAAARSAVKQLSDVLASSSGD